MDRLDLPADGIATWASSAVTQFSRVTGSTDTPTGPEDAHTACMAEAACSQQSAQKQSTFGTLRSLPRYLEETVAQARARRSLDLTSFGRRAFIVVEQQTLIGAMRDADGGDRCRSKR